MSDRYFPKTNVALDQVQVTQPIDFLSPRPKEVEPERRKNTVVDIVTMAEKALDEVDSEFEKSNLEAKDNEKDIVVQKLESKADLQTLQETADKQNNVSSYSEYILEGALTAGDDNYSPALHRLTVNQQVAVQLLEGRIKRNSKSGLGVATDFIDRYFIRQWGMGNFEDVTRESEFNGTLIAAAQASMDTKEFEVWFNEHLDKVEAEGVFKDENMFALMETLNETVNAGYDPDANLNQVLAGLDLVSIGAASAVTTLKGVGSLSRLANLKGSTVASKVGYKNLDAAGALTDPDLLAEAGPASGNLTTAPGSMLPNRSPISVIDSSNSIVRQIEHYTKVGAFGRPATEAETVVAKSKAVADFKAISSRPINREDIVDIGLNRKALLLRVGKAKDGAAFKSESAATKQSTLLNEQGLDTKVIQTTEGYFVEVTERLDLTRSAGKYDVEANENVYSGFSNVLTQFLGSTRSRDVVELNTLANMSESGTLAIQAIVKPYIKQIKALPINSQKALDRVFRQVRDGEDSHVRDFYNAEEFSVEFQKLHPQGKKATQKDIDAYFAAVTINDAAYILKANAMADRFVTKGYKIVDTGVEKIPAKQVTVRPREVYDVAQGKLVNKYSDKVPVWKTSQPLEGGVEYVINPVSNRVVLPWDVLPYNAGGRRINPDAKFFVTAGDELGGRALLATTSTKQAKLATEQIDNIYTAIKSSGNKLDDLTDELDDVIRRNNDWNPSIEDTADLKKFFKDKGWPSLSPNISFKKRDGIIESADDLWNGMSVEDYINVTNRRNDQVLTNFGGGEVSNYNPTQAMVAQLSDAGKEYAYSVYTQRAKTAWVKKAFEMDDIPSGMSVNTLFDKVDELPDNLRKERLKELHAIIGRRQFVKSKAQTHIQNMGQSLQEWVFDKTGKNIDAIGSDPVNMLLGLGFQSAFGFLNLGQFLLQASHSLAIASLSPVQGSKALAMVPVVRMLVHNGSELGIKRFAKTSGLEPTDVDELLTYIRSSGRYEIEGSAAEKGTAAGYGIMGYEGTSFLGKVGNKVAEIGQTAGRVGTSPFSEGERMSRLTGITTAFLEYKKLYKGSSALTDSARSWIARREGDLTLNMQTSSRGAFQDGLMRLPTQWLSHSLRMMEAVTVGKTFTKVEKVRLGGFMVLSAGMFGMGMGKFADDVSERLGIEPDGDSYVALKYGLIDGVMSWALDGVSDDEIRTAFGTRISPLAQLLDLKRKVQEDNAYEVIGGPSVSILYNVTDPMFDAFSNIVNGYPTNAGLDVNKAVRQLSGVDNIWKAVSILNYGSYQSRSGTQMPMDFNTTEALLKAVGINNFKDTEFYQRTNKSFRDSKEIKGISKDLGRRMAMARDFMDRGDRDRGIRVMDEVAMLIDLSGLAPIDKVKVRRNIMEEYGPDIARLAIRELSLQNRTGAEVVESLR